MHMLDRSKLKIGMKQVHKELERDNVSKLYVSLDADEYVTRNLIRIANDKHIEIIYVESMKELGKACQIDVGAATAVIVNK